MRRLLLVAGIIVLLMGSVWSFQGAGYLQGSFMSNDRTWIFIGATTAFFGLIVAFLGIRQKPATTQR